MPDTLSFCGVSTVKVTPAGGSISIGCENPSASVSFLPWSTARYPVPLISRSLAKPVVTPVTMFAISVRVRPWSARFCCASSGRCTAIFPSSRSIFMLSWNVRVSWPFGPLTLTVWPSILMSTPLGMATGIRPILLMSYLALPDIRQDLATEALALRLAAGHEAGRGRDDRDAEPAEHARHLVLPGVHAEPGLRDAAQTGDRGDLADVLQAEHELARVRLFDPRDVALVAQDAGDLGLHPARRDGNGLVARDRRIADAREKVGDRIVRHPDALRSRLLRRRGLARRPFGPIRGLRSQLARRRHLFGQHQTSRYQLDFVTPGSSPISARSRKQIRQRPNLRRYPRGRPHTWHRLWLRTLNFGVRCCFRMRLFFAI